MIELFVVVAVVDVVAVDAVVFAVVPQVQPILFVWLNECMCIHQ